MKTTKNHRTRAASLAGLALLLGALLGLPAQAIDVIEGGTECVPYEIGEQRGQLCVSVPPEEPCEEACDINEPCDPMVRMEAANPCQPPPTCDPTGELVKVEGCEIDPEGDCPDGVDETGEACDECMDDPVECAGEKARDTQDGCSETNVIARYDGGGDNRYALYQAPDQNNPNERDAILLEYQLKPLALNVGVYDWGFAIKARQDDTSPAVSIQRAFSSSGIGCVRIGSVSCAGGPIVYSVYGALGGWVNNTGMEREIWVTSGSATSIGFEVGFRSAGATGNYVQSGEFGQRYTFINGSTYGGERPIYQEAMVAGAPWGTARCV